MAEQQVPKSGALRSERLWSQIHKLLRTPLPVVGQLLELVALGTGTAIFGIALGTAWGLRHNIAFGVLVGAAFVTVWLWSKSSRSLRISSSPLEQLRGAVRRYGDALWANVGQDSGLLHQALPDFPREAGWLAAAVQHGVVADLVGSPGDHPWPDVSKRLQRRLVTQCEMSDEAAAWTVDAWGSALGRLPYAQVRQRPGQERPSQEISTVRPIALGAWFLGTLLLVFLLLFLLSGGLLFAALLAVLGILCLIPSGIASGVRKARLWCLTRFARRSAPQQANDPYATGRYVGLTTETGLSAAVLQMTMIGHTGGITGVAISADGRYALSGSRDRTVRLWDVMSGEEVRRFTGFRRSVRSVALSPDGRLALAGGVERYGSGVARVWEVATGQELIHFRVGHPDCVWSVAFAADGRSCLCGAQHGAMRWWDVESGELKGVYPHPWGSQSVRDEVRSVVFSPDGRSAVCGYLCDLRVWDLVTGIEVHRLEAHRVNFLELRWGAVLAIAFSPDGRWILSGSRDQTARLWDATSGKEVCRFEGHRRRLRWSGIVGVAFTPDGRRALSASEDGTILLWEPGTGEELRRFETGNSMAALAFSPNSCYALSGGRDWLVRLWKLPFGGVS
jgi:WD40 repeat protein